MDDATGGIMGERQKENDGRAILLDQARNYPEATEGDAGVAILRGALSATPFIGGAINELLSLVLQAPLERRKAKWIRELAADLDALIRKVDGISWESLGQNEEFMTATIHASRIALTTHQEEKPRYLRNALRRVAAGVSPSEEIRDIFFRCVDDFGPGHVTFMNFLSNDKRRTETDTHYCNTCGQFVSQGMTRAAARHYGGMFPLILKDLWTRGFTYIRTLDTQFRGEEIITREGKSFLHFITEYEPSEAKASSEQSGS